MMSSLHQDAIAASASFQETSVLATNGARSGHSTAWPRARARAPNAATDLHLKSARPSSDHERDTPSGPAATVDDELRFEMHEVQHRLKNIVAVIQSICNQTIRHSTTKEDFAQRFSARMSALCDSLDLLIGGNWKGIELHDLVKAQLGPFGLLADGQIVSHGPPITLGPDLSRNIGMALHELATNAVKHGSLSVPKGKVSLDWQIAARPEGKRFEMTWVEAGGPPVTEPTRRGFGRQVIQSCSGFGHNGLVAHQFLPNGVRWTLDLPESAVAGSPRTTL